jgi:trk system potassium uptake protein TrkH
MWRALLQWVGGLGVIAFGVFVLPLLNIGGVSYFNIESSSTDERPFERFSTYAVSLLAIYGVLTGLCVILYAAAGMTGFDAITHAMTTLSTGGYSTHDASLGHYADNLAVLWVSIVFMFIGALPFTVLILFIVRGRLDALADPQIRTFGAYLVAFSAAVTIYLRVSTDTPFLEALTHSVFNFTSLITTTGYASADYSLWGPFVVGCAFVATFMGGCSGSTSGAIKAYRFLIVFELLANGLRRLIYPNMMLTVRYGDRQVEDEVQRAVVLFVAAFLIIWCATSLLLTASGLDLVTAVTGALTALTNVGPGLGDIIGPAGNFASLSDFAKWVLSIAMLLGRLEILAVLVIFSPVFWER